MPAKNLYHDAVVEALRTDGWTITDDPLRLRVGERDLLVDLGAERPLIGAEKGNERIAVEVQSFISPSAVADLQQALGQYAMYRLALAEQQPDRPLFLAVPTEVYNGILSEPLGQLVLVGVNLRLLVFDPDRREVIQWIS
jgi:XisH protein